MSPKRRRIYTKIHSEQYEIAIKLLLLLKLSTVLVSGATVRLVPSWEKGFTCRNILHFSHSGQVQMWPVALQESAFVKLYSGAT